MACPLLHKGGHNSVEYENCSILSANLVGIGWTRNEGDPVHPIGRKWGYTI